MSVRSVWQWLKRLFFRTDPVAETLATFGDKTQAAERELERQRQGLEREMRQRQQLRAELERAILTATRNALTPRKRIED